MGGSVCYSPAKFSYWPLFPKELKNFLSRSCGVDFYLSFSTRVRPVFRQELVWRVSHCRLPQVAESVAGLRRPLAVLRTQIGLDGKMAEGATLGSLDPCIFDKTGKFQGASLGNPGLMRVAVGVGNRENLPRNLFFVHFLRFLTIMVR